MPDCVDCGFSNSFSAGLVVCRNCGTALPHEPKSNSAAHSDSALPKSERTTSTIAIPVAFDPENGRRPKRLVRVWLIVAFAVVGMFLFAWMAASGLDSTVSQNLSGVGPLPTERQEWSIALDDGDIVTIAWDPIEKRQTYVNGELVEGYSASTYPWNEASLSSRSCSALRNGAELLTRDALANEEDGELASAARRRAYSQFMMDRFDERCMG